MQPIQNKWIKSAQLFVAHHAAFLLMIMFTSWGLAACHKERPEVVHIKGRIVTKGTRDPILMGGIKFGIYEAQPSRGILSTQEHLLIDSFETDANGSFDHVFKNEAGLMENMSVNQINVVPGYTEHEYRYPLMQDAKQFEKIEQTKRIMLEFSIDNRNGLPSDAFSYYIPGRQITTYQGNGHYRRFYNSLSYTPLRILIANHQLDTQYNIDVFFETLDTASFTFDPHDF